MSTAEAEDIIDYMNFRLIGNECYREKKDAEKATIARNEAIKKVHELEVEVAKLKVKNMFGSPRKSKKHFDQLEEAINKMQAAKNEAIKEDARHSEAMIKLMFCIDALLCKQCKKRGNHWTTACATCDDTNFYSCQHYCLGVERCKGCKAELKTDLDKAYHKQVFCIGCNDPYYYCDSAAAEYHRPRICQKHNSYYFAGEWYYEYMGQLFKGFRYCHLLYRDCRNETCNLDAPARHSDYKVFDGNCPNCSGIPFLADACPLHDSPLDR